jgi:hypothetical protein
MPLPASGSSWPIAPFGPVFSQYATNAAWMEGDSEELRRIYSGGTDRDQTAGVWRGGEYKVGGVRGAVRRWWNGQPADASKSATRIHSPLAGNLARLSATMLVSEPPTIRIIKEVPQEKRQPGEETVEDDIVRRAVLSGPEQDALDQMLGSPEAHIALRRGSEWAAGIGLTAYSWAWDTIDDEGRTPRLNVHRGETVIPEWQFGRLRAITVTDEYPAKSQVLRHLMRHEPGAIVHALYLGTDDKLGQPCGFNSQVIRDNAPHLADIAGVVGAIQQGLTVSIPTGTLRLTAALHINLPTIRFSKSNVLANLGRADIEGPITEFLDAHDEAWSSWMRDLKIGRGRLYISQSFLEGRGPGQGAWFNEYAEMITTLNQMNVSDDDMKAGMVPQQFDIRVEEHAKTCEATKQVVLETAGWSSSSYGDTAEQAVGESATGVVDRAKRTENTRDEKMPHLAITLKQLALSGLDLYRLLNPGKRVGDVDPATIEVKFADVSQIDPEKQARTLQYLQTAKLMSREVGLRNLHPEWDDEDVLRELKRIEKDNPEPINIDPFATGDVPPENPNAAAQDAADAGANDSPAGDA